MFNSPHCEYVVNDGIMNGKSAHNEHFFLMYNPTNFNNNDQVSISAQKKKKAEN